MFKRYSLIKTLTKNFNILSNADADADANADANADAGVTAIALPVLSYRRANKNRKKCHLSQGSRGRRTRHPGTSKSGLRHMFSSVVIPGAQVVFAAIRPNIYLCFVVYEPKKHLRDIHPCVFHTFMMSIQSKLCNDS